MTRTIFFLAFLFSSCSTLFSNPKQTDPFTMLGITEVYIPQPNEWFIELDSKWVLFDSTNVALPCSSNLYLLISRPSSGNTNKFYHVRVGFGDNGYGVISRSSLTGINKGLNIPVSPKDTIIIALDTAKTSQYVTSQGKIKCWKFPLRSVSTGNSLVALSMNSDTLPDIYETSRKSIGKPCGYKTFCYLTILNQHNNLVTGIQAHPHNCTYDGNYQKTGSFKLVASISIPKGTVSFDDPYNAHPYPNSTTLIPDFSLEYNDKDSVLYDTIKLNFTSYILKVTDSLGKPVNGVSFFYKYPAAANDRPIRHCKFTPLLSGKSEIWHFRIYKSIPVETLSVAANINSLCTENSIDSLSFWSGSFKDTSDTIYESVIVDPVIVKRQKTLHEAPSVANFSVLNEGNRSLLLIFTSPRTIANAFATLYTVTGKEIKSEHFDIHPGTNTIRFWLPDAKKMAGGTYLCKLGIGDHASFSQRIVIQ